MSVGYNRDDYQDFQGWEEGVIEQLQRTLRTRILARLQIAVREQIFAHLDSGHIYNNFIEALERLRVLATNTDMEEFYMSLLSTAIRERPVLLLNIASRLEGEPRRQFITAFAKANATLRTRRVIGNLTP